MTRKEKKDYLAKTLNIRPSTASIAVDMLEQQKMFLAAIARNEYNKGFADAKESLIDRMLQVIDQIDEGLISHTDELREAIEELRQ